MFLEFRYNIFANLSSVSQNLLTPLSVCDRHIHLGTDGGVSSFLGRWDMLDRE